VLQFFTAANEPPPRDWSVLAWAVYYKAPADCGVNPLPLDRWLRNANAFDRGGARGSGEGGVCKKTDPVLARKASQTTLSPRGEGVVTCHPSRLRERSVRNDESIKPHSQRSGYTAQLIKRSSAPCADIAAIRRGQDETHRRLWSSESASGSILRLQPFDAESSRRRRCSVAFGACRLHTLKRVRRCGDRCIRGLT